MSRIITLQGRGDSGKTSTIKLVPDILIANGYHPVPGMHQNHGKDFLDIYENGIIRVGVTSSGDSYDLVYNRLADLVAAHCDICICACRTRDNINPGTIAAVNSFPGFIPMFIPKSYASTPAAENLCNTTDANRLFSVI